MATKGKVPERAVYKTAEVCALAELQPYVLRSWESEFPNLGVARKGASTRVYRREDVDRVLRIKALILDEGLTLGAARRKLLEESPAAADNAAGAADTDSQQAFEELLGTDARQRVEGVKSSLREILALLGDGKNGAGTAPPAPEPAKRRAPRRAKKARAKKA